MLKLIKGTINRLEMKLTYVANAFDYYMQLLKELTKDKTNYFTQLKHQYSKVLIKNLPLPLIEHFSIMELKIRMNMIWYH